MRADATFCNVSVPLRPRGRFLIQFGVATHCNVSASNALANRLSGRPTPKRCKCVAKRCAFKLFQFPTAFHPATFSPILYFLRCVAPGPYIRPRCNALQRKEEIKEGNRKIPAPGCVPIRCTCNASQRFTKISRMTPVFRRAPLVGITSGEAFGNFDVPFAGVKSAVGYNRVIAGGLKCLLRFRDLLSWLRRKRL